MARFVKLKARAEALKNEVLALSLALKDRRTPLLAKILIGLTVSYALSPIDLIPDFIPVLGYVDDLIVLPALIAISIRLIPPAVLADCRARVKDGYTNENQKTGSLDCAYGIGDELPDGHVGPGDFRCYRQVRRGHDGHSNPQDH